MSARRSHRVLIRASVSAKQAVSAKLLRPKSCYEKSDTMADDALLSHYTTLLAKAKAWTLSWKTRGQAPSGTIAFLLSQSYLGVPLASQLETRLLESRREIDNQIARYAGTLAVAIALLCRAGDTDPIERSVHEAFLKIGPVEDGFESKLAELEPLVELYRRLSLAMKRG